MSTRRATWWLATLGIALLLCGCGGGNGTADDPLTYLQGSWFGPAVFSDSVRIVFDDAGQITEIEEGGVSLGLTGTMEHVTGTYYEGELSDTTPVRLFLDPTLGYAAFFGDFQTASLQRGATTLPAGGFVVADVAPGTYSGSNLVIDDDLHVTGASTASATILGDGSYSGSDGTGLVFGSPVGTMLEPSAGILFGPYEDNVNPTTGAIDVLPSPDLQFLTVTAYPQMNNTLLNVQFIGAWSRD